MQLAQSMKATIIPPLRVSHDLRKQAEAVLDQGETLSTFVLDALSRSIAHRKARQSFTARALASAARAKKTGKYVSAGKVMEQLARNLATAKQHARKGR